MPKSTSEPRYPTMFPVSLPPRTPLKLSQPTTPKPTTPASPFREDLLALTETDEFLSLTRALENEDYLLLARNLMQLQPQPSRCDLTFATQEDYQQLLEQSVTNLEYVIRTSLLTLKANNPVKKSIIHDMVFHFCQLRPERAGEILNENMIRSWGNTNRYALVCLLSFGANPNVVTSKARLPTMLHAVTQPNMPSEFISLLLQHGACYEAYHPLHHGLNYSYLLVAALNRYLEAVEIFVDNFPRELSKTSTALEYMAKHPGLAFPCENGSYLSQDQGEGEGKNYSQEQIADALNRVKKIQLSRSALQVFNQPRREASPTAVRSPEKKEAANFTPQ